MPDDRSVAISLPIDDRLASSAFYRAALGWEPIGEPAADGVPEPLQYDLGGQVRLVLVPTGGFAWVLGDRPVARPGSSECLLAVTEDAESDVDATVARAVAAGATVVTAPGVQPWGYAGTFADPDGHAWMVQAASSSD